MAECAKNLSQFNRGTSAMQHYVGLHPMFDVEVMNTDARLVLGNPGDQPSPSNVVRGLSSLYKDITDPVRKESATITSVFPSPNDVMSILVQRVLEDRVPKLLEKLLVKPSLTFLKNGSLFTNHTLSNQIKFSLHRSSKNPIRAEEGGAYIIS